MEFEMSGITTLETELESSLQCPVCLTIPRALPVPACPAGHILCQGCRAQLSLCPTCRRPFPANSSLTNSIVGGLIEKVAHRCRHSVNKCEVRLRLAEIIKHEERCPERTVKCPYVKCGQEVQLKMFHFHALEKRCVVPLKTTVVFPISKEHLKCRGVKNCDKDDFDTSKNKIYTLAGFTELDKHFYIFAHYSAPKKTFIMCVFLAEDPEIVKEYKFRMILGYQLPRKLIYEGPCLPLDYPLQLHQARHFTETCAKCFCVSYETIKGYFHRKNMGDVEKPMWHINLGIKVEIVKAESTK